MEGGGGEEVVSSVQSSGREDSRLSRIDRVRNKGVKIIALLY